MTDYSTQWNETSSMTITVNGNEFSSDTPWYVPLTQQQEIELREELAKAQEMASTDSLTGLNNRRAFDNHVSVHIEDLKRVERQLAKSNSESKRTNDHSVLVYIDLFDFKGINDVLGHQYGDKALKIIADFLKNETRPSDFPARIGGDEFAILIPNGNKDDVDAFVQRLKDGFNQLTMDIGNNQFVKLMATIGTAVIDKKLSVEENLDCADQSMYEEKADHGETYPKAKTLKDLLARNEKTNSGSSPKSPAPAMA